METSVPCIEGQCRYILSLPSSLTPPSFLHKYMLKGESELQALNYIAFLLSLPSGI